MWNRNVDLNRVQLFLEIVRLGSITKTAELFRLQKSKVSRDLALLEEELGTQLIYRTTRQFHLTVEGQRFYERVEQSVRALHVAIEETTEGAKRVVGAISITCPEDIGQVILLPLLQEFQRLYPGVTFNVHLSAEIIDLVANNIDMAIRPGALKDSSLKMKKIGSTDFGIYCSKALYESLPPLSKPDQLTDLPIVHFGGHSKKRVWRLLKKGRPITISVHPQIETNNYLSLYNLIKEGVGLGLIPQFLVKNSDARNHLVQVYKDLKFTAGQVQIIFPSHKEESYRVKVLSEFLVKRMKVYF